jgi:membrane peptidoglycan carboxypeptidase
MRGPQPSGPAPRRGPRDPSGGPGGPWPTQPGPGGGGGRGNGRGAGGPGGHGGPGTFGGAGPYGGGWGDPGGPGRPDGPWGPGVPGGAGVPGGSGGPDDPGGTGRRGRRRGRHKRSLIWRLRRPLFLIGLATLAATVGVGVVFAQTELPQVEALTQSSYICAADVQAGQCTAQTAMARMAAKVGDDDGDRINVAYEELPQVLVDAVIATEDRDFFEHQGIDPVGISRALYRDLRGQGVQQGGSTITQQYVKNAFDLTREKSITRKINEAVLSVKLEREMSKQEILEGYLNTIYFGRGAYGVGAASQAYFGLDVRDTKFGVPEAAFLAGLIRAPNLAEPTKHPEEAARRRHTALEAMQDEGYITEDEAQFADAVALTEPYVRPFGSLKLIDTLRGAKDPGYIGTDYVTGYVKEELVRLGFTDQDITSGGLRVYTSLNYDLQTAAWQAVTSTLVSPNDPEAALVAVDDQGLVRAMVGSRNRYDGAAHANNYAVRGLGAEGRQTGSIAKPLALAEAVRHGFSLESRFDAEGAMTFDSPEALDAVGKPWKVSNYSESDAGVLDLMEATKQSSNTFFAQLMLEVGPQSVADLAEQLGIGGGEQLAPNASMVLGTTEASPLEMAGMYSTFANRGVYKAPEIVTRVERVDQDGKPKVVYERQVAQRQVLSPEQSDLVTHALRGPLEPGGTGDRADLGKPAAGKTGTAQHNWDAWFAGYVPKLTAVVWMGYPQGSIPMENVEGFSTVTGGSLPAEIWRRFMEVATNGTSDQFVEPTAEQVAAGTVINEGELYTADETTTTAPPMTLPPFPVPKPPGGGGGGGGGRPTTTDPNSTTTSSDITVPTTLTVPTFPQPNSGEPGPG